jgi:tetratricopeptide (TPR) repeat protein
LPNSRLAGAMCGAIFFILALCQLHAEGPAALFEAANKLYEQGKYPEAAAEYQKLLAAGQGSVAVFFNLGNAYFKSGQIGRAVLAYHQAQRITPRDPDLRANLQFARNQSQGPAAPASRWFSWLENLTLNEWTLLASAAIWLFLLLLSVLQWRPAWKAPLRGYVVGVGLALLITGAGLSARIYHDRSTRTAVVVIKEAQVRQGPFEESNSAFTAHDGAELDVLDQKDEWLQVSAGPRRVGWIRRDQAVISPAWAAR